MRRPLCSRLVDEQRRRIVAHWCSSETSGDSMAAAARGSPSSDGSCSLATSSDCTTMFARSVERLDLVDDAHDRAMGEGDEASRRDADGAPRRRAPLRGPRQRAGAEVEHAIVGAAGGRNERRTARRRRAAG